MVMTSFDLSIVHDINDKFNDFLKTELKNDNIPIFPKHFELFMMLANNNNKLEFNEISEKWQKSKPKLHNILEKYVEIGLIEKDYYCLNKESSYIKLTVEGFKYVNKIRKISIKYIGKVTEGIAEEQKNSLEEILAIMKKSMDKKNY